MLLVPTLDFDSDSLLPGVETVISALSEKPNKGLGGGGGRGGGEGGEGAGMQWTSSPCKNVERN